MKSLIIYGPTATGKTALAISLAKKFNGELISADSRQVYKGLDIGTGKVSFESKIEKHNGYWIVDEIKINGFDLYLPGQRFSVADFLKFATTSIIQIIEEKKLPIIVGGTGFYVKALMNGIDSIGIGPNLKLRQELENLSKVQLYQKLVEIDYQRASKMNESDRANPRRLIRAVEIAIAHTSEESKPTSEVNTSYRLPTANCLFIGLTAPNDYLYQRADRWLEERLQKGLIEEVKNLLDQKISPIWLESLGLEYKWITKYLLGHINYDTAITRLKGDIHNFIRRQKTWSHQFKDIRLFDISDFSCRQKLEKKIDLWYTESTNDQF